MTQEYLKYNPFPYQGTITIEGTSTSGPEPSASAPTVTLRPIERLREALVLYLQRFRAEEKRQGQLIVLRGERGSGKTHSILFVSGKVASKDIGSDTSIPQPVQLYVKADNPQFLELYQRLLRGLTFEIVREVSLQYMTVVTAEQIGRDFGQLTGNRAVEVFRENPQRIEQLFAEAAVDRGVVEERQAEELKRAVATGREIENFQRAFSFLPGEPDLARSAYNWLVGESVRPDDLRRLGVSGPITSAETGRVAISLFATLFRRSGRPLIIYIDQYENLVADRNVDLSRQNIGRLRSLVEDIPNEKGMLVLSGNEDAWRVLPPDIQSRVPDENLITLSVWTLLQARELVRSLSHPLRC